jgi:hypothetical protein
MVHQKFSVNLQKSLLHFLPILGPGFSGFGQDIYFNYSTDEWRRNSGDTAVEPMNAEGSRNCLIKAYLSNGY